MSKGDPNNGSALNMSVHSGTHIDAPFHFVAEGLTIDDLPLDRFIGSGLVFAVDAARYITQEHVESIKLDGATRVLFKTRNSELLHQREYEPDFAAFSVEGDQSLVERGVELVGLDYLSIAHADEQVRVHRAFSDHGVGPPAESGPAFAKRRYLPALCRRDRFRWRLPNLVGTRSSQD